MRVLDKAEAQPTNAIAGPFDRAAFIAELRQAMAFVESRVINRQEVVEQIFLALIIGEHVLLESRTGVGKTLLAEQVFQMFEGARVFKVQASKEQQPDTYFGGLDLAELKQGRNVHNTEGSLVESEFGFIDEIFDANDYTLRALLSVLNERELVRGVQRVPSSIHSVIAATNYLRISEITEALLDRFLFKALVLPDKEPYYQYKIGEQYLRNLGDAIKPPHRIPFRHLLEAQRAIRGESSDSVSIAPELIYFLNLVIRHYEVQRNRMIREHPSQEHVRIKDFYISPRTQAKSLDLVRAIAYLHGRNKVDTSDISKLYFLLCTIGIPEQKSLFQRSYDSMLQLYSASGGLEQMAAMLNLEDILNQIRLDPQLMEQPIAGLEKMHVKQSIVEWAKETIGLGDSSKTHKRKLAESYLASIHPATEDLRSLKMKLEKEIQDVFGKEHEPF